MESIPYSRGSGGSVVANPRSTGTPNDTGTYTTSNIFPTIGNAYNTGSVSYANNSIFNASKTAKGHVTNANLCLTPDLNGGSTKTSGWTALWAGFDQTGCGNNMRTDYLTPFIDNKYP